MRMHIMPEMETTCAECGVTITIQTNHLRKNNYCQNTDCYLIAGRRLMRKANRRRAKTIDVIADVFSDEGTDYIILIDPVKGRMLAKMDMGQAFTLHQAMQRLTRRLRKW